MKNKLNKKQVKQLSIAQPHKKFSAFYTAINVNGNSD